MPGLVVGSAPASGGKRWLVRDGITLVVDLREAFERSPRAAWPAEVTLHQEPTIDGEIPSPDRLEALTALISRQLSADGRVFVHCAAGVGRSTSVVCAVLLRMGYPLSEAYRLARLARPVMSPTDAQLAGLRTYAAQLAAGRRQETAAG